MGILRMPEELLVAILAYLGAPDILAFRRTSRRMRELYEDSSLLQYLVELDSAGLEETISSCKPDYAARLTYVVRREELWELANLDDHRRFRIPVEHDHSHLHALSGSVYVLADLGLEPDTLRTSGLHYISLPTCIHKDRLRNRQTWWKPKSLGVEAISIGLSLEEQDLLAVLTTALNEDVLEFHLHLKMFSGGENHPFASRHDIKVHDHFGEENHCVASIQICGSYLLILLTWLRAPDVMDEFYVYDWKQGSLIKHESKPGSTYRAAVFLSSDTYVLTNIRQNTLDFMQIVKIPGGSIVEKIGSLCLPDLRPGSTIFSMTCWTDDIHTAQPDSRSSSSSSPAIHITSSLSPSSGQYMYPAGPVPFKQYQSFLRCQPDKTLVQFRVYVQGADSPVPGHVSHFSFVAHRGDLLRIVREGHGRVTRRGDDRILGVSWEAWGPCYTRWSGVDVADAAWMASVSGQRQAIVSGDDHQKIRIRDYNENTVRKHLLHLVDNIQSHVVITPSTTAHQGCFTEDIRSSLPYVESVSSQEYDYDAIQIDNNHIIGVKENEDNGLLQQLDVFVMVPDSPRSCDCNEINFTSN